MLMDTNGDSDSDSKITEEPVKKVNDKKRKATNSSTSAVKKKGKKKDLYKQPTPEELMQLRETENLYHSNLYRLQIEEILKEVKIQSMYTSLIDTWLKKFKENLNSIKDTEIVDLNDDTLFEDCNIKIPFNRLSNDYSGTFKFLPPSNIMKGGSFLLDTAIGPNAALDILVEMPLQSFRKKDIKNYIYMRKKAIYLAYIAKYMDKELVQTMCFCGNHSNPILKVIPSEQLGKRITIYIHVVVQDTAFNINKLLPEKNNVKYNWFFEESSSDDVEESPTPHYNSTILYDLTALKNNVQNANVIKEHPHIRDGIILLKIWLKQRNFSGTFETFNGHIVTMYVLYLLYIKKINKFMSSYQILRNTWQYLAQEDWCNKGISLSNEAKTSGRVIDYHNHYDCVFLDSTGYHNLATYVLQDTFKWIADLAQVSMDCLNTKRINGFQELFLRKVPFYKTFDQIICFYKEKAVGNIVDANSDDADKLNYGSSQHIQAIKLLSRLLRKGLGNRITLIGFSPRKLKEWEMSEDIPNDVDRILIGLSLDSSFCFSIIEKGPGANLPEAETFRGFWGEKSELRRFKDGTICEAVVWANENSTVAQKRKIPQIITKFLLDEKLKLFENIHYFIFSNQIEEVLMLKKVTVPKFSYGTEEASLRAISAFGGLEKDLTGLTDLPLSISGVQGCSSMLRYTDVFPPLPRFPNPDNVNVVDNSRHMIFVEDSSIKQIPLYMQPIEAVLQMCTSGKWPDDLEALRMTKAAFYIQIAECLRKQHNLQAHGSMHYVDVIKDNLAFRLRIANQREIGLLKQEKGEDGVVMYRDNEESIELEEQLFQLPKLTGALSGLHLQYASFGPACCLTKRWLSSHLIDNWHMPDIVTELIMASIYLNPEPERIVQQPQVAFLRFLESFAKENWTTDPIIVNFNNEMSREDIIEVENLFGTSQDKLPPLFISSPYDKKTSTWTRQSPSLVILHRISALAKEVLRIVEVQLLHATSMRCDVLFKTPITEYDCLIRLKDSVNPRRFQALDLNEDYPVVHLRSIRENYKIKFPILGFDPVDEYLKELRSIYNEFALFFHDTYGGSVIGVLLKPQAYQQKDFKVPSTNCQKLTDNNQLILNIPAMIEDFYILGNELVLNIDIQSEKLNTTLSVHSK